MKMTIDLHRWVSAIVDIPDQVDELGAKAVTAEYSEQVTMRNSIESLFKFRCEYAYWEVLIFGVLQ
jgi:hypothetical protein